MALIKVILYFIGLAPRTSDPPTFRNMMICACVISVSGLLCLVFRKKKRAA